MADRTVEKWVGEKVEQLGLEKVGYLVDWWDLLAL
jgi:hypothetical protein